MTADETGPETDSPAAAASEADTPADGAPTSSAPRKRRGPWPWIALGVVCAIGLGIFMWAVGGRWNLNSARPSGPATTPVEAVQKYMAAVDNHDRKLAESYMTPRSTAGLPGLIGSVGYLRYVSGRVISPGGQTATLAVTYDEATSFLNDKQPVGLNLALLVWTQRLTRYFSVARSPDGSGWLVDQAFGTGP